MTREVTRRGRKDWLRLDSPDSTSSSGPDADWNDARPPDPELGHAAAGNGMDGEVFDEDERERADQDRRPLLEGASRPPTASAVANAVAEAAASTSAAPSSSTRHLLLTASWLIFWCSSNVALTLLCKATFSKINFHYPCFLSFCHMTFNAAGTELCHVLAEQRRRQRRRRAAAAQGGRGRSGMNDDVEDIHANSNNDGTVSILDELTRTALDSTNGRRVWVLSIIFTLNIAMGNVSLQHVSVNFNQVMRSLIPALTIAFGATIGRSTSWNKILAICPVVIGVALATYGDISYTTTGFLLTCLSVVLAALRVVASGEMVKGSDDLRGMHSIDLLGKMAPRAAVQCLALSVISGEIAEMMQRWDVDVSPAVTLKPILSILATSFLAFALNVSFLEANRRTSPLTLCVASNVKQVVMMGLGTAIFNIYVTPLNGAGILIVLAGSLAYGCVSVRENEVKTGKTRRVANEVIASKPPETELKNREVS